MKVTKSMMKPRHDFTRLATIQGKPTRIRVVYPAAPAKQKKHVQFDDTRNTTREFSADDAIVTPAPSASVSAPKQASASSDAARKFISESAVAASGPTRIPPEQAPRPLGLSEFVRVTMVRGRPLRVHVRLGPPPASEPAATGEAPTVV